MNETPWTKAAAPTLYEALADARATLEECAKILAVTRFPGVGEIAKECAARCGAALAKARGES